MTRLLTTLAAGAAIAAGLAAIAAPVQAQSGGGQIEVAVFGTDPCPRSTESQIVVCKHYPESERYRLNPSQNPQGTRQQRTSWARKSQVLKTVGATGIGSCSAVGPGGFTGCLTQEIKQARRETREQQQQDTPPE
jgi:hypothetical protein